MSKEKKQTVFASHFGEELANDNKCKLVDTNIIEPCARLKEACEYGNPYGKRKGLYAWNLYKTNNCEPTLSRRFFGAKSGNFVNKGIAFNYCPFCGEEISQPFTEPPNAELRRADVGADINRSA